ncbi:hypothetical protein [Paenibacillus sp. FSL H8-0034]|uniref:hypothetical protein n=1 Tax=Paenibacillus sp. FSL H8-0034 TaxID=2954671 RepID=UPI0030F4C4DD
MQSANTLTTRSVQLQLLSPLQRGSTKQTIKAMRNPEEVHYANQIRRAATQMMDSNNLSAITYPLSISIRVYHDSAPDDPLLIIKLVMDALQGVCYINDMQVQSVHYELCVASRKDYHIEINCGSLPLIAVQGTARGKRYPLYCEADLASLEQAHSSIAQSVAAAISSCSLQPIQPLDAIKVEIMIYNQVVNADIDNLAMNYWDAYKAELHIANTNVRSLKIERDQQSLQHTNYVTIDMF